MPDEIDAQIEAIFTDFRSRRMRALIDDVKKRGPDAPDDVDDPALSRRAEARAVRKLILEYGAKLADISSAGAVKHYGVAESVGADMAARRIRAAAAEA